MKIPFCRLLLRRFKISWFLVEGKRPFSMHRKVNFGDLHWSLLYNWVIRSASESKLAVSRLVGYLDGMTVSFPWVISYCFTTSWCSFMRILWRKWLTAILCLGHRWGHCAFLLLDNLQMFSVLRTRSTVVLCIHPTSL